MSRLRIILLCALVATAGLYAFSKAQESKSAKSVVQQTERPNQSIESFGQRASSLAVLSPSGDLALNSGFPERYPRPPSEWINREKDLYSKKISSENYDVLVLPFQVDGYGFNYATRITLSALLTKALSQVSSARMPDPFVLARALGEGQRSLDFKDVQRIADATNAKRIIIGHAGHDTLGHLSISVELREKGPSGSWVAQAGNKGQTWNYRNLDFSDRDSPMDVFERLLPELLANMGYNPEMLHKGESVAALDIEKFPATPKAFAAPKQSAAREGYIYQFFAAVTPRYFETTKDRFASKAFIALSSLSEAAPEYRALRARAYLGLGYRSAAIATIGDPKSDEEKQILAMLNGDLPLVASLASKESNVLKRLLATLDKNKIEVDYGLFEKQRSLFESKSLAPPNSAWDYLITRKLVESDNWSQFENLSLKDLLDREFPVEGFTMNSLIAGARAIDDLDAAMSVTTLSVNDHIQKYLEADSERSCCLYQLSGIHDLDYLDLIASIGHDNVIRRVLFLVDTQGRPAEAVRLANSLEPVYRGQPNFSLASAKAKRALAMETAGAQRQGLLLAAQDDALNAAYWEQKQSLVSSLALAEASQSRDLKYGYFGNVYSSDIPHHAEYVISVGVSNSNVVKKNGLAALGNATSQFSSVLSFLDSELIKRDRNVVDQVSGLIADRFIGCPAKNEFLAKQRYASGDTQGAISLYTENIKQQPNFGSYYLELGIIYHSSGNPQEAAKVFLSSPELKDRRSSNRVKIANTASTMGGYFYQSGDIDVARKFYEISAAQETGAYSEIVSALRLKLFDGDIAAAAAGSLHAAQRYGAAGRYRDYIGILHATGNSSQAWAGFAAVVNSLDQPQPWESALVGHHREEASESDALSWARQPQFRNAGNEISFATEYVVRFATTDRIPSSDLAKSIQDMDRPTWKLEGSGQIVRPELSKKREWVLGPRVETGNPGMLAVGVFDRSKKQHVKSDLAYFVEGYRAVKQQDFALAKAIFDEAAGFYDMSHDRSSYMLPYYAIAAAKAGDTSSVKAILDRFQPSAQTFDFQLASAAIFSIRGELPDAVQALRLARYRRPDNNQRPLLTPYTFGDVCEIIYLLSGNTQIRDMALEWAKVRQRIEPWQSWSYALETAVATKDSDRRRAIAYTYYLDPNSEHLKRFSKTEIDSAVEEFGTPPIFSRESSKSTRSRRI